jgi:hypothetical protein
MNSPLKGETSLKPKANTSLKPKTNSSSKSKTQNILIFHFYRDELSILKLKISFRL